MERRLVLFRFEYGVCDSRDVEDSFNISLHSVEAVLVVGGCEAECDSSGFVGKLVFALREIYL